MSNIEKKKTWHCPEFSADTENFLASPVRDIFKHYDLSKLYSFAGGYPAAEAMPVDLIKSLCTEALDSFGSQCLQYGATQGLLSLREELAAYLKVSLENILISSSSQQGIDVCSRVFIDPDDVVLCLNPSYLGALQSFRSYRADIRAIDLLENLEDFEKVLRKSIDDLLKNGKKIKFFYLVPDFQNPTGQTLSLEQRKLMISLAREYSFLILEDSPYRYLRYEGEDIKSFYELDPEISISLGSFSKIFAPGLRLGWILASTEILEKIYVCKQALDLCPAILDQHVAYLYLKKGYLPEHLNFLKKLYAEKRDLLLSALEEMMPKEVSWTRPEGGLFIFLYLPKYIDTVALYPEALSKSIAYVAGSFFYPDASGKNTMRLNFSFLAKEKILEGIKILSDLIKSKIRNEVL